MKAPRPPRQIAPRLFNGQSRLNWGGRLPPHIKDGIRRIARDENKSMSWVLEEVVIEYFKLDRPRYRGEDRLAPPPPRTVTASQSKRAH